jgi:hypothetical protein
LTKKTWLMLLLLGSGEAAIAQTTATRPPSFGASARPSRGAPTRQIGIRAGVDVGYDSNVYGINDAILASRGLTLRGSKDDFSISPSIQLDILLPLGRQSVFARGSIGYDFYLRNSQLNRERINLALGGNLQVTSGCSTTVTGNYQRQRSNAGDVYAVSDTPLFRDTNTEENKAIGVQGMCGGAIGITPGFGYTHSETRNSNRFFKLNDSNQDSFNFSLGYSRPALGRIALYGTYAEGEYINRNILGLPNIIPGVPADGIKSYSAGIEFERNIGSRLSGRLALGYSWVDPKSPFSSKFRGASYTAALNFTPSDRLAFDLLATRSTDLPNSAFASYSITDVYSINATYRLNERLSVNAGAAQQRRNFHQRAATVDQAAFVDKDKFNRFYGGFVYELNQRIRLNGLVSHQRRGADNPLFRYSNTTASLGVSLSLAR